jgi:leucine dehydrogenase
MWRWGSDDLGGKRVSIQGCGNVGYHLAKELHTAGASLIVADVDASKVQRVVDEFAAQAVAPDRIYSIDADVFAPCALGGIVNDRTISQLRVEAVCGAANNQLLEMRHGDALEERGILYAPDYVANAGGVLSGGADLFGWPSDRVRAEVLAIYDTMLSVFEIARADGIPSYKAADRLAEKNMREGIVKK